MIYCIDGKVLEKNLQYAVLFVNGIGYKLNISINTYKNMKEVNEQQFLYTYMNVREDAIELFGFSDKEEKDWFKLLISISGIGPKVAIGILSDLDTNTILTSILNNDYKTLTKCSGVGAKTAQRVVLELKDKVKKLFALNFDDTSINFSNDDHKPENNKDVYDALMALGYQKQEIMKVISKLDMNLGTSEVIKKALKLLAEER